MHRRISDAQQLQSDDEDSHRRDSDTSRSSSNDDVRTVERRRTDRASVERQSSDEEREETQECDRFEEIRNLEMQRCFRVCEALKQKLRRQQACGAMQYWILQRAHNEVDS